MALIDGTTISERFSSVSILQADYKSVNGHAIRADFLIPKSITAEGKRPVIVQFHGGGLMFGDSLYSDWFPPWIFELAVRLGESTGVDILKDVDDFWQWLRNGQADVHLSSLPTSLKLDVERVLTTGESAGGFLSVYLALTYPDEIRAATACYPMFNQEAPVEETSTSNGSATPHPLPVEIVTSHVANMKPGDIVSSDITQSRLQFGIASTVHGKVGGFIERDADASPVHRDRLSQTARLGKPDTHLPRGGLVILHGKDDAIVPVGLSERFVRVAREKLRGRQGADNIVLSIQDGDHGFDNVVRLDEPWLQKALETAVETWLE